jgi:RND family efflux transporter MFP subunit
MPPVSTGSAETAAPAPPAAPGSPLAPSQPLAKPGANRGELASLKIDRSKTRSTPASTKLLWFAVLLALLAALGGAGYWALRDRLFPLPTVKVESVRIMTLGQAKTELTATGYLESRWQAAVGAKVPGRIANIPVEEGDVVKEGDVLAELEHSDLDAMLASRKVAVTLAEAQLAEAQSNLDQAKRDFERESDVFQRLAGARSTMERAQATYFAAQSILNARAAAVAAAKSAVTEAEESIRNMFIYAPFAGTVLTKDAERGESIMPGGMGASSGRGSVITLAQLDKLEVDTDVKEDYLGSLRTGQPAQVLVDAVPDRRYKGRLREIIPMGDRTRGIVKVKVEILNPDERLFPELSATVNFLPDQTEAEAEASLKKGVFAPAAAIQGEGDDQYVWLLEDNKVRQAAVKAAGDAIDGLVPVTGSLVGGEQVVIGPPPDLETGDEVQLAE